MPSLGQLASSSSKALPSSTIGGQQPKLADLAKLNLRGTVPSSSSRPSLSQLANWSKPQRMVAPPPQPGELNLASALRSKCVIKEERRDRPRSPAASIPKEPPIDFLLENFESSQPVDRAPTAQTSSSLGRVLAMSGPKSATVFLKFSLQNESCAAAAPLVKPFDFSTPSPDDIIKSRLRIAQ